MPVQVEEAVEYKTCLITVVDGGIVPDRVIKVYPAEHADEKIWLNNAPGQERWEAVKRLLYTHAERGTRVPDPVKVAPDVKTATRIKEEDIPVVRLADGAFLKAPPPEDRAPDIPNPLAAPNAKETADRLGRLESSISQLATAVATLVTSQLAPKPAIQANQPAPGNPGVSCDKCGKGFKDGRGLYTHSRTVHKGG